MENSDTINISLAISRRTALFILAALFLAWRPGYLGSETLTLTTYYPAPYGGYAGLLTTGGTAGAPVNTLLVRDAGNVGVGTGATVPVDKLTVAGAGTAISAVDGPVRNRFFSSEGAGGGYVGTSSNHPLRLRTNDLDRLTIASGGEVQVAGDLRVGGSIVGMCAIRGYSTAAMVSPCPGGHTVFQTYGNGVPQVFGYFTDGVGTPIGRLGFGQDWNGTMLCCRIN